MSLPALKSKLFTDQELAEALKALEWINKGYKDICLNPPVALLAIVSCYDFFTLHGFEYSSDNNCLKRTKASDQTTRWVIR